MRNLTRKGFEISKTTETILRSKASPKSHLYALARAQKRAFV